MAGLGKAGLGKARQGKAGQGKASQGPAWQGKVSFFGRAQGGGMGEGAVDRILALYPRREALGAARPWVAKALDVESESVLTERVRLYAEIMGGAKPRRIVMARRWFQDERWQDDPSIWRERASWARDEPEATWQAPRKHSLDSLPIEDPPWKCRHPEADALAATREFLSPPYSHVVASVRERYQDDPEALERVLRAVGDVIVEHRKRSYRAASTMRQETCPF